MPVTGDFDSMDPWLQHEAILEDVREWVDESFAAQRAQADTPHLKAFVESLRLNVQEHLYRSISLAGQAAVEGYQEKHTGPCCGGTCEEKP